MFVRLLIGRAAIAALLVVSPTAVADQAPTFVLTVKPPVGGKPQQHKLLTDTLQAREVALKPILLAKTKTHPASRLNLALHLLVSPTGAIKASSIDVNYRDGKGSISDDSFKTVVEEALKKTKALPKDLIGATVDVTIAILQP